MRQRIFKVVFVGDSGVGKSSFIHRFCNDNFNPTFSATIGRFYIFLYHCELRTEFQLQILKLNINVFVNISN